MRGDGTAAEHREPKRCTVKSPQVLSTGTTCARHHSPLKEIDSFSHSTVSRLPQLSTHSGQASIRQEIHSVTPNISKSKARDHVEREPFVED